MPDRAALSLRDVLESEIVEGALAPGERLDEVTLAKRFAVSRTPIREALHGLASSGLVELRPRRGAFVREVGATELVAMFETMGELEAACARFACARMTAEQERELIELLDACAAAADAGDSDAYYIVNERFHAAIYEASGNRFLAQQARALQARLRPFRRHQLNARGRLAQSMAEHHKIVRAIRAGDAAAAEAALRDHVVVQGARFSALVASLDAVAQRRAS